MKPEPDTLISICEQTLPSFLADPSPAGAFARQACPRRLVYDQNTYHNYRHIALSSFTAYQMALANFAYGGGIDLTSRDIFYALGTYIDSGCPCYLLAGGLAEALFRSDLPDRFSFSEFKLPHESMIFILPKGALPGDEGEIAAIGFSRVKKQNPSPAGPRFPVLQSNYDGICFFAFENTGASYARSVTFDEIIVGGEPERESDNYYPMIAFGGADNEGLHYAQIPGEEVQASSVILNRIITLGAMLILYLNTPKPFIIDEKLTRKPKVKKGRTIEALYSPPVIDFPSGITPHSSGAANGSGKASHVRRGHFRTYRHSRYIAKHGQIEWIAPTAIHPDREH